MAKANTPPPRQYVAVRGINIPPNDRRVRPGDVVMLPDVVAQPLLREGAVKRAPKPKEVSV